MNALTERTPQLIAAEINSIKEQTRKLALVSSIEIGRRLVEAKSMLDHGQWGPWLGESVEYSQSTANNLMRIFEEYGARQLSLLGDEVISQAFGNLKYSQAVALLGLSPEEREEFVKENDPEIMSTREFQRLIKEEQEKFLKKNKELTDAKADVKSLEDALKKEKQTHKDDLATMKAKLDKAKAAGASEEELQQLRQKVKDLEEELKKPVTLEPTVEVKEVLPENVQQELELLRVKTNPQVQKFTLHFEVIKANFQSLREVLQEMRETDTAIYEKCHKAVSVLARSMLEKLI